jgi:hypothetical protein
MNIGMNVIEWFRKPTAKIGFDDVLFALRHPDQFVIINTLPPTEQACLIQNTVSVSEEETVINEMLTQYEKVVRKIVLYGKNATDTTVEKKRAQLNGLGIGDVYVYSGGLFEWMLLQDIYGEREFSTTQKVVDMLKYKPRNMF